MTQKYSGAQNFVNYTQINENLKGGAYYSPSYVFNDYNTGYNLEGGAGSKKKAQTQEERNRQRPGETNEEYAARMAGNLASREHRAKKSQAKAQPKAQPPKIQLQPQQLPQLYIPQPQKIKLQPQPLPQMSRSQSSAEAQAKAKKADQADQEEIDELVKISNDLLQKYQNFITDLPAYDKDNRATPNTLQMKINQLKEKGANTDAKNIEKSYTAISEKIKEAEQKMPEQITSTRIGQASSIDEQTREQENVERELPKALNIGQADAIQGATEQFNRGGIDPNVGNPNEKITKLEGNKPLENLEEKYTERIQEFEDSNNYEESEQLIDEAVINNPQTPAEIDPDEDYSNDSFLNFTEREAFEEAYKELVDRLMKERGLNYDEAIEIANRETRRTPIPKMPESPFFESVRTALERKREGIKSGIESGLPSQILPQRQGQGQATPSIEEQKQGLEGQGDNMLGHSDLQKLTDKVETGFNLLVDTIINKNDRNKLFSKDTEKQITEVLKGAAKILIKDPNGLLLPTDKQLKFGVDNVLSSLNLPKGTEASMKQSLTDVVKMTTGYMGEPIPLLKVKERIRLQADPVLIKKRVSSYFGDKYILQRAPTRIVQPTEYLNYLRVGGVRYA